MREYKKILTAFMNISIILSCFFLFLVFLVKSVLPEAIHINILKDGKKENEIVSSYEVSNEKESSESFDEGMNIKEPINKTIKVFLSGSGNVVEMDIEQYVKGVVSSEMPALFEIEALKAQAIAARTFAIGHMESNGGIPCINSKKHGADICDTTHCQVYRNKADTIIKWEQENADEYWKRIKEAVESTEGEVIEYNGKVIDMPLYFAVSSGTTENIKDVFNAERPYLLSVKSYGDDLAPKYTEIVKLSKDKFINILNENNIKVNKDEINSSIEIVEKNSSGSISKIRLGEEIVDSVDFRRMFSLNSTNVKIKITENDIEITCVGYGHGVGMSQWGANAMARDNKTAIEIIEHYYTGTKVEKIGYKE